MNHSARPLRPSIGWIAAVALATTSCAQLVQPVSNVNFLSVEQERPVADEFATQVEKENPLVRDARIVGVVTEIGRALERELRSPEFTYTFRVVDDPSVNAFNIGGGYVYVHTGLLRAATTEAQLASVLAHEIGHQVYRHVAKAISRQQLFQTLATVAVGPNSSAWLQLAGSLGLTTGQAYFGREAEREADGVLVELMLRAGYDPREALVMFETLAALDGSQPGAVANIFRSHPPTRERTESVRAAIAARSLPPDLVRDTRRYQDLRRHLGASSSIRSAR